MPYGQIRRTIGRAAEELAWSRNIQGLRHNGKPPPVYEERIRTPCRRLRNHRSTVPGSRMPRIRRQEHGVQPQAPARISEREPPAGYIDDLTPALAW